MTEVVRDEVEFRPEWYQVHYNLAAHSVHRASKIEEGEGFLHFHRREGRAELERLKVLAEVEARSVVLTAGKTIGELHERERAGRQAKPGRDERHASSRSGGRTIETMAQFSEREGKHLENFLSTTVEPAAAVLLAGLMMRWDRTEGVEYDDTPEVDETGHPFPDWRTWTRDDVMRMVRTGVRTPEAADALIRLASEGTPSYRARYNLACYWSERLERPVESDEKASIAKASMTELRLALSGAPAREAPRLAQWGEEDPTLDAIRRADQTEFYRLTSLFKLPVANK